jgi:ketosteroid isomerase-like protein
MQKIRTMIWAVLLASMSASGFAQDSNTELLKVRRSVWLVWLANDQEALKRLVPDDTVVISAGESKWKHQAEVLQSAADFHAAGGKLISLKFPRTEVQRFGDVAITWSEYVLEVEVGGKRHKSVGRVTEIFVKRDGEWTNPGWHTDSEGSPAAPPGHPLECASWWSSFQPCWEVAQRKRPENNLPRASTEPPRQTVKHF